MSQNSFRLKWVFFFRVHKPQSSICLHIYWHFLYINKVPIQQVENTKFLGVIIDDNLNWSNHISYINSKIAKGIGIICTARKFFSKSALINLYYISVLYLLCRGMG